MIDIHSHMMPGVDDGARNIAESLTMAEMAVKSGVEAMILTPHSNLGGRYPNLESQYFRNRFYELKEALEEEHIPLQIYRGMEVMASIDLVEKINDGQVITLNNSRYILVEFPFDEEPWMIDTILKDILNNGNIPIVAHPERYFCVQEQIELVEEWKRDGALFQMNKGSILGRFGRHEAMAAEQLLKNDAYVCVASDAHHARIRTTEMREVKSYISKKYSTYKAEELLKQNPLKILRNKSI